MSLLKRNFGRNPLLLDQLDELLEIGSDLFCWSACARSLTHVYNTWSSGCNGLHSSYTTEQVLSTSLTFELSRDRPYSTMFIVVVLFLYSSATGAVIIVADDRGIEDCH